MSQNTVQKSGYKLVDSSGSSGSTSTNVMRVYLYPNTTNARNETEGGITDAITDMCNQALDHNAIDDYAVFTWQDELGLTDDDIDTFYNEMVSWVNNNTNSPGSHVCISEKFSMGKAQTFNNPYHSRDTAFGEPLAAVVGTDEALKRIWKNTAIHEVLHNYINGLNPDVDDMIDDKENHHDLGKIRGFLGRQITPMATGYNDSAAGRGNCSRGGLRYNATTLLTSCTKDAIKYTAEDS